MEPRGVPGIPVEFDAGINRGLGVPASFYHFAFEAGSEAALAEKRDELRARGVQVTDIVDHRSAKSIYFKDPNGLSSRCDCQEGRVLASGTVALTAFVAVLMTETVPSEEQDGSSPH
jgi:hypothetical protein